MTEPTDFVFQLVAPITPGQDGRLPCFAARRSGLYRSMDNGRTWELAYASLNAPEALPTTAVALAPEFNYEPTVFAGLNGAILCSYDGGIHWQPGRLPAPLPAISSLAVSPCYREDGMVFAGTNEDGVLVSSDRGKNWILWNFGLLDLSVLCLAVSPEFAVDETLFAGTESGLFRSTNGGRAWKEVSLPIGFDAVLSLAISPNFTRDSSIFAGTENNGVLVSQDRGKNWKSVSETTRSEPVNSILLSPRAPDKALLILHGGTMKISKDGGISWRGWKTRQVRTRNVTAVLAPPGRGSGALIGFEDGSISQV